MIASDRSLSITIINRIQNFAIPCKYFNLFCYLKKCLDENSFFEKLFLLKSLPTSPKKHNTKHPFNPKIQLVTIWQEESTTNDTCPSKMRQKCYEDAWLKQKEVAGNQVEANA